MAILLQSCRNFFIVPKYNNSLLEVGSILVPGSFPQEEEMEGVGVARNYEIINSLEMENDLQRACVPCTVKEILS